jgi:peroxiredoxin
MAKINSVFLDQGDKFPEMELKLVSGETMRLPEATGEGYGVVLFYRGYW